MPNAQSNNKMDEINHADLVLKSDHSNRPIWVTHDGRIFLEAFSPVYKQAYEFLITVAEPVSRPEIIHEYRLTPHSLYAAVSMGLDSDTLLGVLDRLSKVQLSDHVKTFIRGATQNYGKVKIVLKQNRHFVESPDIELLHTLQRDPVIHPACTSDVILKDACFEIRSDQVEHVKERCLPGGLNYPMLEEYDFSQPPHLEMQLKPHVKLRPYQEKSLAQMFGGRRARSGIIVLPCGAGKSLVGVAAAARLKKPCLCLCTSSVSVDQWKQQFHLWTNLQDSQVSKFTSECKEVELSAEVTITTFTMIAFSGKRSEESEKIMATIRSREWGLLLMDEVHVVPAQMFRKVIGIVHSHVKLGLTATLVREDDKIDDLNFLIGPKLYEANWLDLSKAGHIATVQCVEVRCPMTREFYAEYLKQENAVRKQLLYVMNPHKFQLCRFLIEEHAVQRQDKVIVFSDNIWSLKEYAARLRLPYIYGDTTHAERTVVLNRFKHDASFNVILLSKVGDNSIDLPEANVLIQISSHAGSRRQEAQRLGRILRAKDSADTHAFFYTLISQDTEEMYYASKRQQFLIDQGYTFKVLTDLLAQVPALDDGADERTLLSRVLHTAEEEKETLLPPKPKPKAKPVTEKVKQLKRKLLL